MTSFTAGLIVSASLVASAFPATGGGNGSPRAGVLRSQAAAGQATVPGGERLTADTPKTTVAGNTFVAPAGWSSSCAGRPSSRRPGGSLIALVDVPGRQDADAAVAAAWAAYKPDAKWPLKVTNARARQGRLDRTQRRTRTRPRRTSAATSAGDRAARQRHLDGRDLRHGAGRRREARRAGRLDLRPAAAEGLHARVVRRQEGAPARRRAPRGARRVRRERPQGSSACRASRSASSRTARSCSPAASACASSASRRRSTPTRCYMIASNTKAMTTLMLAKLVDEKKLTWDTPVTRLLPSFKLGDADDHEPGAGQAPDLRLHRHAAAGLRVAASSSRASRPNGAMASARHDAADEQVRRAVPVLESAGRRRRLRRRARRCSPSSSSARPTTRRCRRWCSSRSA